MQAQDFPRTALVEIDLSFESKMWTIHIPSFREVASEEQRGYFKEASSAFSLLKLSTET
jgi:hypothetical protein